MESRLSGPGAGRSHTGARGKDFAFPGWSRNLFSYSIYVFWDYLKTTRYSFMIPSPSQSFQSHRDPGKIRGGVVVWEMHLRGPACPAPQSFRSVCDPTCFHVLSGASAHQAGDSTTCRRSGWTGGVRRGGRASRTTSPVLSPALQAHACTVAPAWSSTQTSVSA